jgi:mannose-6-phosphate isomerase-like protein (cupin superfamily)
MKGERMQVHELATLLEGTSEEEMALQQGDPSRIVGTFNRCLLGAVRFSAQGPWERHPDGDELLHVLEGDLELTILAPEGRVELTVSEGSVFVVPRGLWHRSRPRGIASMLFATPTRDGEISFADDPTLGK